MVVGLIVIWIVFYLQNPAFLSSRTVVSMMQFAAPVGIISLGIVLVLLLGEIDLSVGSVSGLAGATMAVLLVYHAQSMLVALLGGILVGTAIGLLYAALYNYGSACPASSSRLAGLLGFQGALLVVLGKNGTVNIPDTSGIVQFARNEFVTGAAAYVLVLADRGGLYVGAHALRPLAPHGGRALGASARLAAGRRPGCSLAGLAVPDLLRSTTTAAGATCGCCSWCWSWSWTWRCARTTWGRHLFAVGGNEEAARRSGIKVDRIYVSVFVLCSTLAALGGVLAAGQNTAVTQSTGTTDTNLTAIAAAVIGGTSLFGGRGSAYSAMLGILVLQAIQTGLNVIGVASEVRFIVTGAVLLLAVAIDSISRRARSSSGRG